MKIHCKILLILVFALSVLFIFNTDSFASFSFEFEGISHSFPDLPIDINNTKFMITYDSLNSRYFLSVATDNQPFKIGFSDYYDKWESVIYSGSYSIYQFAGSDWSLFGSGNSTGSQMTCGTSPTFLYANFDVYKTNGELFFKSSISEPELKYPIITNTEQILSTGNFDYLCINSGDFHDEKWQDFYLMCYDYSSDDSIENIYPRKIIKIDGGIGNKYYTNTYDNSYIFMIPLSDLSLSFKNNCNYGFKLATGEYVDFEGQQLLTYDYFFGIKFSVSGLAAEDLFQNSIDNMNSSIEENTNVIKEQTEVNKNIFEKIGEILSYLNPFSENFFAYKLISLLLDGLKSLFIPSNDFFSTFFTDLKEWFSDRLGFLFYPFELIIDILNKIMNINFSEPVFEIPDINEPFTNSKLISATSYNLNDLLKNSIFKTVHNIYLLCVDAFIVFGLVNLAKRKFEEVTNK